MKPRSRTVAGTLPAGSFAVVEPEKSSPALLRSAEWGRKAILVGWIVAMVGIAGYVYTMINAPEDAGMLAAISRGGVIGWLSAAAVLAGVVSWLAGNIALMRAMVDPEN